jgi:DNA-binding IclR family transcriptional regulator
MSDRLPIKTTQTIFDILEILLDQEEARLHTLVDELGMARSTVHDHLRSLETMGLVVNDDSRYRVSTRFLEMGERVRRQQRTCSCAAS